MNTRSRRRRGAQAVEFAMIAPFFLMMISGIVDFGWYFQQESAVNAIVRDAGRHGSLTSPSTAAATTRNAACAALYAERLATSTTDCSEVSVTVSGTSPDQLIAIAADPPYRPLFGATVAPSRLHADLVMHFEGQ
jgi:Flp pilus assembly protein TadG